MTRTTDKHCIEGVYIGGTVRAIHYAPDRCMFGRRLLVTDDIDKVTCKRCLKRRREAMTPHRQNRGLPEGVRWERVL